MCMGGNLASRDRVTLCPEVAMPWECTRDCTTLHARSAPLDELERGHAQATGESNSTMQQDAIRQHGHGHTEHGLAYLLRHFSDM